MPVGLVVFVALIGLALLGLAASTAHGARRRGAGPLGATLSGAAFPLTWIWWYVQDEPLGHRQRGTTRAAR